MSTSLRADARCGLEEGSDQATAESVADELDRGHDDRDPCRRGMARR
jgi:hypothetical protein